MQGFRGGMKLYVYVAAINFSKIEFHLLPTVSYAALVHNAMPVSRSIAYFVWTLLVFRARFINYVILERWTPKTGPL